VVGNFTQGQTLEPEQMQPLKGVNFRPSLQGVAELITDTNTTDRW